MMVSGCVCDEVFSGGSITPWRKCAASIKGGRKRGSAIFRILYFHNINKANKYTLFF